MKNFKKIILFTVLALIAMGTSLSYARFEGAREVEAKKIIEMKKKHLNIQIRKAGLSNQESPRPYNSDGCSPAEADAYDQCMEQTCSDAPNDSESMECDDACVEESGCDGSVEFEE